MMMMLSSVALRAQVASVIDTLARAATEEIAKLVEDGMVLLRLEMGQRDQEIQKLKGNIQLLHTELRAARGGGQGSGENLFHEEVNSCVTNPEVKPDSAEKGDEEVRGHAEQLDETLTLYDGNSSQWRSMTEQDTEHNNSVCFHVQQDSLPRVPESSPDAFGAVQGRTPKRLKFKMGFICSYCGKCFKRAGHLVRHERIHTGEKPYHCEVCGRRFNQKCSLKEHMKIHTRGLQPTPAEAPWVEEKHGPEANPCAGVHLSDVQIQTSPGGVLPPPVRVKSEPVGEEVTQPQLQGGAEPQAGGGDGPQQRMGPQGRDSSTETSAMEYLNSSSFPGIAPLPPAPLQASCSSSPFPGKPFGEDKNRVASPTPYGSHVLSGEAGPGAASEAALDPRAQSSNTCFQEFKLKKSFPCSFCGKAFKRSGHLQTHLRIHTGEKPYSCSICGRCFSQKSSLKVHMNIHRDGDKPDVPEAPPPMFTMPDHHPPELRPEPAPFEDRLVGREALDEHVVMVKVESNEDDFQAASQVRPECDTGASQELWTSGMEDSSEAMIQTVCVLSHDMKYGLGPAAASEQQGHTCSPPGMDTSFLNDKENKEVTHGDYAAMELRCRGSDVTLAPELQVQHADEARQNCFICSSCGQSFDSFSLLEIHRCKNIRD